jgi:hypothetical protein
MQVLRQCKVPRAEIMFVTIQCENIRLSKKEINAAVTMLPNYPLFAVKVYESLRHLIVDIGGENTILSLYYTM